MAGNTKKKSSQAVEESKERVDKQQEEAKLDNDIYSLNTLNKGGNGGTSTTTTKSNGGTSSGSSSGTKGGSTASSGTTPEQKAVLDAIGKFEQELEIEKEEADKYNQENAEKYGFNTKNGNSEYYQDFSTIKRDKDDAEKELEKAKSNNKVISENRLLKDMYSNALKAGKQSEKEVEKVLKSQNKEYKSKEKELTKQQKEAQKKADGLHLENIDGELDANNWTLSVLQKAKEDLEKTNEGAPSPDFQAKMEDIARQEAELTEKNNVLLGQLKDLESLDSVSKELEELKEQQKAYTSENIDVLLEWAEKSGSDNDKARAATIKSLRDTILKADEDGIISEDEAVQLKDLMKQCDDLIEAEEKSDKNIVEAQNTYDSARAKFSYFLFDQIKAIAAFIVGLSVGSPQMVYSALDMFNQKIANAEAKYRTDTIEAFSNNNIKNLTGKSDAEYVIRKEIVPELKKQKAFQDLSEREKEISVRALEKAFEEYRRYANKGGGDDFRAWFTSQTATGNGSGWASVITTLIQAGALNWDAIMKAFGSNNNSSQPKTKGGPVSFNLGTQGQTNELMQKLLQSQSDELASKHSTPQVSRDKQGTVINSLASKIPQQPAAPQNGPVQARNNSRWNAIG